MFNFLVFNLCLVMGYTFSIRFYQPGEAIVSASLKTVTSENQASLASMDNGQRSILLVSASSIDLANPTLESIWLATYLPAGSTIQLFPIFPSGDQPPSDFEMQLEASFRLSKAGANLQLDGGFIRLLEKNNFWWSGYVVFDHESLSNVFSLFGGLELNGRTLSGAQVVQEFPTVEDGARQAFSAQVAILQSVCHKLAVAGSHSSLLSLGTLASNHIVTNLDAGQLQADLQGVYSADRHPTCRFPTLEISRIEP